MKCPKCGSEMFMVDETVSGDSFYYKQTYYACPKCGYIHGR